MGAEKAARKFLEGLQSRERKPWDEPVSGGSAPMKPKPSPPAAHAKGGPASGDAIGDQVRKITERNADLAKRTRHLRGGSRY